MKKIFFFSLIYFVIVILPTKGLFANPSLDSISYETQRNKVNNLLDERVKKFGEFDQSLEQKTGFFGLIKSKNDMQKSIDILQDIVKMDNKIFIETRNLLKIKDYQAEKYQQLATEYDNQVTAYMRTISKLQASNEKLKADIEALEKEDHSDGKLHFILSVIIVILLIVILYGYRRTKIQKLTKL